MSKGIYKITNIENKKVYIGKSTNIEQRWKYHKQHYLSTIESNKPLYKAFRKYGIDNFTFEIIEYLDKDYEEKSNEREKYWIRYYNSYGHTGYNATPGGDGGITVLDAREKYGKLTNDEVIYLRKRYLECKYPASYIYEIEFKDKISRRGFQAIWLGQNAKDIMPEVFTLENKKKQIQLSRSYEGVLRRRVSLEEKKKIKNEISNGKTYAAVWKNGYQDIYSLGGFRDMVKSLSLDEEVELNGQKLDPLWAALTHTL